MVTSIQSRRIVPTCRQVVAKERPDIERRKTQLLLRMAEDKKQLSDLEARILHLLSNSSGNILDDEVSEGLKWWCFLQRSYERKPFIILTPSKQFPVI